MGMFDHVVIDLRLLPITKKERMDLKGQGFQTKSMDNNLDTIHIKRNEVIVKTTNTNWLFNEIKPDAAYKKLQDYSGCIQFYTDGIKKPYIWYEFLAKIRHGKLKEVIRVYERI